MKSLKSKDKDYRLMENLTRRFNNPPMKQVWEEKKLFVNREYAFDVLKQEQQEKREAAKAVEAAEVTAK